MDYSPDAFSAFVTAVEQQGGALLPDPCIPSDVKYSNPPYIKAKVDKKSTCGCGNESRFVSTYDPKLESRKGGAGFVTACAVCDSMGSWPRYS